MEFNNLRPNILYLLHNRSKREDSENTIDSQKVINDFSDIPEKNIRKALSAMQREGLIQFTDSDDKISLTRKGKSEELIERMLNRQ